jgi:hypothetical protein
VALDPRKLATFLALGATLAALPSTAAAAKGNSVAAFGDPQLDPAACRLTVSSDKDVSNYTVDGVRTELGGGTTTLVLQVQGDDVVTVKAGTSVWTYTVPTGLCSGDLQAGRRSPGSARSGRRCPAVRRSLRTVVVPRTRTAAALVVLAATLATALYLRQRDVWTTETHTLKGDNAGFLVAGEAGIVHVRVLRHPSWETPAALVLALGGIAVAVVAVGLRRREPPAPRQPLR